MMIMDYKIYVFIATLFLSNNLFAQDDLESLLNPISENSIVINTFKSTRIINNHSVEIFNPSQLDVRISHRFGALNSGLYELYGLDQATIRIGLEYGIMENMMIGFGRSSYNKTYDTFIKYLLLKQQQGTKNIPMSVAYFSNVSVNSSQKDYPFLGRLSFCNQLMIASKINSEFSIQLMPSWIHWNMVKLRTHENDIFLVGVGFRYLISKSVSINSEYIFRLNGYDESYLGEQLYNNSFSIGVDIETGGHVFQLHLTNSLPMYESGFMTRTQGDWFDGGIHFGFNISREFNL